LRELEGNKASQPSKAADDHPAAHSLSAMTSQYFIGGMMPESASPMQRSATMIEIRAIPRGAF